MKLHHCVSLPLVVAWGLLASVCWGQVSPLPGSVKTSTSPPMDQIQAFINAEIDQLIDNNNPQGQSNAREGLIAGASGTTTPIFMDRYSLALDAALRSQVVNDPQMRVRLNGAIVAARVAERVNLTPGKMNKTRLTDSVILFMHDKNEGVVLWGIKAARFIIPAALEGAGQVDPKIIKELMAVVEAHAVGALIQEAYGAFDPPRGATPQVLLLAAKMNLRLLKMRIEQYGKALPEDPSAEIGPVVFLSVTAWGVLDDASKQESVQDLSDLLGLLAQRAQNAGSQEMLKLTPIIVTEGKALQAIGKTMQSVELQNAAKPLTSVTVSASGSEVARLAAAIHPVIVTIPLFKDVKAPPQIAPAAEAAATEPSAK